MLPRPTGMRSPAEFGRLPRAQAASSSLLQPAAPLERRAGRGQGRCRGRGAASGAGSWGASCPPRPSSVPWGGRAAEPGGRRRRRERSCPALPRRCELLLLSPLLLLPPPPPRGACAARPRCAQVTAEKEARSSPTQPSLPWPQCCGPS